MHNPTLFREELLKPKTEQDHGNNAASHPIGLPGIKDLTLASDICPLYLQERIGISEEPAHHCMACLVISNDFLLVWLDHKTLLLQTSHHSLNGLLKVSEGYLLGRVAGSYQGGLVANISDISTREPWGQG